MTHRFDIISLTLSKSISRARIFYFRIKISETYWFKTAQQQVNNKNIVPFLQSNQFQVPEGIPLYYGVQLIEVKEDGNLLIDKKMIFEKDNKKLQFSLDDAVGQLDYKLTITNREERQKKKEGEISRKLKQHIEEFTQVNTQTKFEIMRMGGLYYNFVNRLDPLVKITNYLREVAKWTNPIYTVMFGIIVTLIILMPGVSIMFASLGIIVSKHRLLTLGQQISLNKSRARLIVPKQNFILLQSGMDFYCQTYQRIKGIFQNQDKTELIIIINGIIANAWGLLLLPVFFSLSDILIIALWATLILQHPSGKQMKSVLLKMKRQIIVQLAKVLESYSIKNQFLTKLLRFVEMPEREVRVIKTFFVYEFQHWWFGIWDEPSEGTLKWSDKQNVLSVLPRDQPPKGYQWTSEWMIDVDPNLTDQEGFQYATRLSREFHCSNALFDTIRRRKWKRICMNQNASETPKLKLEWIMDGNLPQSRVKLKKKV